MKRLASLTAGLILGSPALALAAEHNASYRGIGWIYFTFIAFILIYGIHDAFGKKAMYVATPFILSWCYWMLPRPSRMREKSATGVLASLRSSTYRSVRLTSSLTAALLDSLFAQPATPSGSRRL